MHRSKPTTQAAIPQKEGSLVVVCPGAFSYVAHSGGNVPAWLVFIFQAAGERFFFPVRPIAQEKGRIASCFKKFFNFFLRRTILRFTAF